MADTNTSTTTVRKPTPWSLAGQELDSLLKEKGSATMDQIGEILAKHKAIEKPSAAEGLNFAQKYSKYWADRKRGPQTFEIVEVEGVKVLRLHVEAPPATDKAPEAAPEPVAAAS